MLQPAAICCNLRQSAATCETLVFCIHSLFPARCRAPAACLTAQFLNFVKIFPWRTLLANRFLLLSNPSSPQRNTSTVFFHAHFSRPPSAFSPFIPPLRAPLPFPRPEFSLPLLHQHCFFLSPCSHIFYELRRLLINFSASSPHADARPTAYSIRTFSTISPSRRNFPERPALPVYFSIPFPVNFFPARCLSPHCIAFEPCSASPRSPLSRTKKRLPPGSPRASIFVFLSCAGEFLAFRSYHYKVETSRQKDLPPLPAPPFLAPPRHRPTPLRRLPRRARASAASAPTRPHAPVPPPPLRLRPISPARAGCPAPRPPSGHSRPPPPDAPRRCRWQGPHTQTSGNR